jgi:hypothetical protein
MIWSILDDEPFSRLFDAPARSSLLLQSVRVSTRNSLRQRKKAGDSVHLTRCEYGFPRRYPFSAVRE